LDRGELGERVEAGAAPRCANRRRHISSPKESVALPAGSGLLGTAVQAAIDNSSDQSVTDKVIGTFGQDYRRWLLRETT
jgi:hypothetical protein